MFLLSPTRVAGRAKAVYADLAMKKTILFVAMLMGAMTLTATSGTSGLSLTCLDGVGTSGNCAAGRVAFTGTQYPSTVHIYVAKNSTGAEYDNWDYSASGGQLTFTETLAPAGTYTVTVNTGSAIEQYTITTGN